MGLNRGRMGRRESVCAAVFLSVLLLAIAVDRARADLSFLASGSSSDLSWAWSSRSQSDASTRRVLATTQKYISYGALTAGHVPCAPQSGRSYYTPNCPSASGPVRPYTRGCSVITRCART